MSTTRGMRAMRGASAAAVATTIAAVAHTIGGADAPPAWLVAATLLLAAPLCVWLVGRRPSLTGTALAVAAAQGLLHAAFAAVGTAAPAAAGHHTEATLTTHAHGGPGMTVAHAIAAVVTIALLTRGERLLVALARGIRRLLPLTTFTARPAPAPAAMPVAVAPPALIHFLSALSRRGPPALAR